MTSVIEKEIKEEKKMCEEKNISSKYFGIQQNISTDDIIAYLIDQRYAYVGK